MLALNPQKNSNERQIVLHVDIDVEVREKPELAELPVVVCADPKRGIDEKWWENSEIERWEKEKVSVYR